MCIVWCIVCYETRVFYGCMVLYYVHLYIMVTDVHRHVHIALYYIHLNVIVTDVLRYVHMTERLYLA